MKKPNFAPIKNIARGLYLLAVWYFRSPCIRWSTAAEHISEKFCSSILLKQGKITEDVLIDLKTRIKEISSPARIMQMTNFVILCALLLSISGIDIKMDVQGLQIELSKQIREILFFVSVTLSLISYYTAFPARLLTKCLTLAVVKADIPKFSRYKYFSGPDLSLDLIHPKNALPFSFAYIMTTLFTLIMTLAYLLMILALYVAAYFYIWEGIFSNPSLPSFLSHFILIYSVFGFTSIILVEIFFMYLPFRHPSSRKLKKYEEAANNMDKTVLGNGNPPLTKLQLTFFKYFLARELKYFVLFIRLINKKKQSLSSAR